MLFQGRDLLKGAYFCSITALPSLDSVFLDYVIAGGVFSDKHVIVIIPYKHSWTSGYMAIE